MQAWSRGARQVAALALAATLALPLVSGAGALAQDKMRQCRNIQVSVDLKSGDQWRNGLYTLTLQSEGEGWKIYEPEALRGENLRVNKGLELRLNFNDGRNHMVNVNAQSGQGSALRVRAGSRPAIVLVETVGTTSQAAAVRFDITGSPSANAAINGCPGGNLYIEVTDRGEAR